MLLEVLKKADSHDVRCPTAPMVLGVAVEDGRRERARVGRRPDAGVGREGFARGIAEGHADPVLQPVLAVAKGGDEALLEKVRLRDAHGGARLAIHIVDVALLAVELARVDVGHGARGRVLVRGRAGQREGTGNAEVRVVEDAEVR